MRVPNRLRRLGGKKKAELRGFIREHPPPQLKDAVPVRSYKLTTTGCTLLDAHPEVVANHPIQRFRFREQNSQM